MIRTELTDAEVKIAIGAIDVLLTDYYQIGDGDLVGDAKDRVSELQRLRNKLAPPDTSIRVWQDKTTLAGSCVACNRRDVIWIIQVVGQTATAEIRVCDQHRQTLLKYLEAA